MRAHTTYVFQEVARIGTKTGKCGCGKTRTRRQKVWQTLNPYNRNAAGSPKSAAEIVVELDEQIQKWRLEPITCEKCKTTALSSIENERDGN